MAGGAGGGFAVLRLLLPSLGMEGSGVLEAWLQLTVVFQGGCRLPPSFHQFRVLVLVLFSFYVSSCASKNLLFPSAVCCFTVPQGPARQKPPAGSAEHGESAGSTSSLWAFRVKGSDSVRTGGVWSFAAAQRWLNLPAASVTV